jgi:hypothetical protein
MFLLNWIFALVTVAVSFGLYVYVEWKEIDVNWGSAPMAAKHRSALLAVLRLERCVTPAVM